MVHLSKIGAKEQTLRIHLRWMKSVGSQRRLEQRISPTARSHAVARSLCGKNDPNKGISTGIAIRFFTYAQCCIASVKWVFLNGWGGVVAFPTIRTLPKPSVIITEGASCENQRILPGTAAHIVRHAPGAAAHIGHTKHAERSAVTFCARVGDEFRQHLSKGISRGIAIRRYAC